MKYSDEQIEALKQYYPVSDYESLASFFPGKTKKQIKRIAHNHNIKSDNPGHRIELSGKKFGRLTVNSLDHISEKHVVFWRCTCDCGNTVVSTTTNLTTGKIKSCGCFIREKLVEISSVDHTGEKFGLLTAIERLPHYNGKKRTYYRCICECGKEAIVSGDGLVSGKTKTCGCLSRQRKAFHLATNPQYDETNLRYLVYKHLLPNGKVYIGITRQNTDKRWQNGLGYKTQTKFWRAIQKYGWENIEHIILEENLTEKQACEREEYYIEHFKSTDSKFGYNTSVGGTTGRALVYPVMQFFQDNPVNFFESHKQAAELLGVSVPTIRNYISSSTMIQGYKFLEYPPIHYYDIDPSLREIRDESHLQVGKQMRLQMHEKTVLRNNASAKKVCKYDLEGHFIEKYDSIIDAHAHNPEAGNISAVLSSKKANAKSSGGYQWRYDTGDYSDIEPLQTNGKAIYQIETSTNVIIATFYSMAEAERKTGVNRKLIFKSCKRINKTAGGFIWRYKNDSEG